MGKKNIFTSTIISLFLYLIIASKAGAVINIIWKDVSSGIRDLDLQTVAVNPDNVDIVYVGSPDAIYRTMDGGKSWEEVFSLRGTGKVINSIAINPLDTKVIYAGTQDGLYRSKDQGMTWKRIFNGIGDLEGSILFVAINPVNPEIIFIGTEAGLFLTKNGGKNWRRDRSLPSESRVSFITIDPSKPNIIYAITNRGLYKSTNSGINWERIFESYISENDNRENYIITNQIEIVETNKVRNELKSIAINPADPKTVYIGTSEGLFVSDDEGLTWKIAGSSGLISRDIHHLVISSSDPDSVYAATSRGVFRYSKGSRTWKELYKGLTSVDIRFLSIAPTTREGFTTLWAVTKRGVFKTISMIQNTVSKNREMKVKDVFSIFADEPSIVEIQQAAIRYAEVHPEKIEKWRKAAAKRAWLPDLRIGYDKNKDWQSSDYFYKGAYMDNDITEGKDWSWSISLTWELGDLIWNDDQTSIDTRSRLMVQLREDVLNEVTRLYFERRRLQIEMLLSPPEEIKDRIEKELRLQELTADIDALTGFYLSKRLRQKKLINEEKKGGLP